MPVVAAVVVGAEHGVVGVPAGQQPGVTTVIPGARNPEQASQNAAAAALPPLTDSELAAFKDLYDRRIRAQVHDRW